MIAILGVIDKMGRQEQDSSASREWVFSKSGKESNGDGMTNRSFSTIVVVVVFAALIVSPANAHADSGSS